MNFTLVSEFQTIQRRPFELGDASILKPNDANPLVDGEFLELDSSYKMIRGSGAPATVPSFAVFAERGRYETQAIGKVPMLYMGAYEADTLIFDGTGLTMNAALEVSDVTIGSVTKRGLKLATTGFIVGYVSRLAANKKNKLRFRRVSS